MSRPQMLSIPSNKGPRRRFDETAGMPSASVPWCGKCGKVRGVDKCAKCRQEEKDRLAAMAAAVFVYAHDGGQ